MNDAMFFGLLVLLPVTMLLFGAALYKSPPEEANSLIGYRTRRSMASKEAWAYANTYSGKYWVVCGLVTLPLAVAAFFLLRNRDFSEALLGICIGVQLAVLLSVIPATEISLKKNGF
ncbi:MAG: SdpI family protein [Oscillospiraceae bacterium]|jgi:uncharacterized membrane protein|nr:SdpI family protein [Oscillospiraceae bacterium]